MSFWRQDPGPCIVCDAPHCSCSGEPGPIVIEQMPALARARAREMAEAMQETVTTGPVSTATYRGKKPHKLKGGDT